MVTIADALKKAGLVETEVTVVEPKMSAEPDILDQLLAPGDHEHVLPLSSVVFTAPFDGAVESILDEVAANGPFSADKNAGRRYVSKDEKGLRPGAVVAQMSGIAIPMGWFGMLPKGDFYAKVDRKDPDYYRIVFHTGKAQPETQGLIPEKQALAILRWYQLQACRVKELFINPATDAGPGRFVIIKMKGETKGVVPCTIGPTLWADSKDNAIVVGFKYRVREKGAKKA